MAKFVKKPIVIEADQFWSKVFPYPRGVYRHPRGKHLIDTLEGSLNVSDGDWIITGVKGERYPCKPDIFEQTYDQVVSPPPQGRES